MMEREIWSAYWLQGLSVQLHVVGLGLWMMNLLLFYHYNLYNVKDVPVHATKVGRESAS